MIEITRENELALLKDRVDKIGQDYRVAIGSGRANRKQITQLVAAWKKARMAYEKLQKEICDNP